MLSYMGGGCRTNLILSRYPDRSVNRRIIHNLIKIYTAENGVCISVVCSLYLDTILLLPLSSSVSRISNLNNNEVHVYTHSHTCFMLDV